MRCYKFTLSNVTATAAGASPLQVIRNGVIRILNWVSVIDSITDNADAYVELSRQAVTEKGIATSSPNSFGGIHIYGNFVTSGLAQYGQNVAQHVHCPVTEGETLVLNTTIGGTVAIYLQLWVFIEERSR